VETNNHFLDSAIDHSLGCLFLYTNQPGELLIIFKRRVHPDWVLQQTLDSWIDISTTKKMIFRDRCGPMDACVKIEKDQISFSLHGSMNLFA